MHPVPFLSASLLSFFLFLFLSYLCLFFCLFLSFFFSHIKFFKSFFALFLVCFSYGFFLSLIFILSFLFFYFLPTIVWPPPFSFSLSFSLYRSLQSVSVQACCVAICCLSDSHARPNAPTHSHSILHDLAGIHTLSNTLDTLRQPFI